MDGLKREIEATIYDFNLNNMPAKRTAKRIMALIAEKDDGSKVPCSAGLSCAWIDVKERLPEPGQIALWWNEGIRMIEFGSAGSFNGENVPYWMPLPDPPAR